MLHCIKSPLILGQWKETINSSKSHFSQSAGSGKQLGAESSKFRFQYLMIKKNITLFHVFTCRCIIKVSQKHYYKIHSWPNSRPVQGLCEIRLCARLCLWESTDLLAEAQSFQSKILRSFFFILFAVNNIFWNLLFNPLKSHCNYCYCIVGGCHLYNENWC